MASAGRIYKQKSYKKGLGERKLAGMGIVTSGTLEKMFTITVFNPAKGERVTLAISKRDALDTMSIWMSALSKEDQ